MRKLLNEELNRKTVTQFQNSEKLPFVIVLDNIRSLNNIGSIFRTADAFLVQAIYLCGICGTPPHKEIHKTALGATESVDWLYFEHTRDAIQKLKSEGFTVASVEQAENSIDLMDFSLEDGKKIALVFGNEVRGVDQEIVSQSDMCIEIPQLGTKHSFNISVSAGIVLWDIYCKFVKTMQ